MPPIIPPASLDFRNLQTNTAAASFLTAYPGASRPTTSNINAEHANQTIANHITTRLASDQVNVFSQTGGNLIMDITSWYTN